MKGLVMAMCQWEKSTWSSVDIPWIRTLAVDGGSGAFAVGAGVGSGAQGSGADGMGGDGAGRGEAVHTRVGGAMAEGCGA